MKHWAYYCLYTEKGFQQKEDTEKRRRKTKNMYENRLFSVNRQIEITHSLATVKSAMTMLILKLV